MIIQLNKQPTELSVLMEIPTTFFSRIESKRKYNMTLFPDWFNEVFGTTNNLEDGIYKKFERVFNKYKSIKDKNRRYEILKAYTDGIQIENLCNRVSGISAKKIDEFPEIKSEIDAALKHLWYNSLKYDQFEKKANTNIKEFAKNFIDSHQSHICPFCGLEGYLYLKGQSRPALDHWLSKDDFPYSSVNFDNLIPIGDKCNERPAKGTKDVLCITSASRVFYPFTNHNSISVNIKTKSAPTNPIDENGIYTIEINPINASDQDIFDSWDALFNIKINYESFLTGTLLNGWRSLYSSFISKHEVLNHAVSINEFKTNLLHWKSSFHPQITIGFLIYKAYIDNLITQPDPYLHGLMEYFKRQ